MDQGGRKAVRTELVRVALLIAPGAAVYRLLHPTAKAHFSQANTNILQDGLHSELRNIITHLKSQKSYLIIHKRIKLEISTRKIVRKHPTVFMLNNPFLQSQVRNGKDS
jgi:hypothetical protein